MNKNKISNIIKTVLLQSKVLSLGLLFTVASVVVLSLLPPQILKIIIDNYLTKGKTEGLVSIAAVYFFSFVLIGVFDFLNGFLLTVFGQRIVCEIRSVMANKLTCIEAAYFSENASGTIASHFLNDVENINSLFSNGIISMVIDCFKIFGIIISIWIFSTGLGIFALCLLPLLYLLTAYFRKKMLTSQAANLQELSKVNNHISESVKNIIMIKCFHKESYMKAHYDSYLKDNYSTMNKVNFYDSCYSPIIQVITALVTAAVLLLASGGGSIFGVSIGMLTAAISLITNLFAPVDNLGTELQSIQKGLSGIQSIDEFLAQNEDNGQKAELNVAELRQNGAEFCFNDVSFAYDAASPVLEHISLRFSPRQNICFVGRTGVGKTTMFKLITGLLRPTSGTVTLGGTDVYSIKNEQKRQIFGYVEQHFSFVRGNISEQISLWDSSITQEQIEAAMIFTGLHEYVLSLENGYKTDVSDGNVFSKGQKQLLSIARAIVSDPPILLLDEVTANLDSVTEENVVTVLKKAGEKKMILSITHRMSSVKGSDKIILLENGHISAVTNAKKNSAKIDI
ncbi:MAG: ABC transporter ATP-binding protein [Hydrogenoanaerobacterium sp.]